MAAAPDHREVERALRADGWTTAGAGDCAVALRSPGGARAARISPFDPAGPYTAMLYREAAHTGRVPVLHEHRRLAGGGDLQVMEWLSPIPEPEAIAFHEAIARADTDVAEPGPLTTCSAPRNRKPRRLSVPLFAGVSIPPSARFPRGVSKAACRPW